MVVTRDDFKVRKSGTKYKLFQRIGSGWEPLSEMFTSAPDAWAYADAAVARFGRIA